MGARGEGPPRATEQMEQMSEQEQIVHAIRLSEQEQIVHAKRLSSL